MVNNPLWRPYLSWGYLSWGYVDQPWNMINFTFLGTPWTLALQVGKITLLYPPWNERPVCSWKWMIGTYHYLQLMWRIYHDLIGFYTCQVVVWEFFHQPVAPENGWLEYFFVTFWGQRKGLFSGRVSLLLVCLGGFPSNQGCEAQWLPSRSLTARPWKVTLPKAE